MSSEDQKNPQSYTDTNLLCSMIANTEKLVPKQNIQHYDDLRDDTFDEEKIESCMEDDNANGDDNGINNFQNEQNDNFKNNTIEPPNQQTIQQQTSPPNQQQPDEDDEFKEYDEATPTRKKLLKLDMLRKLSELYKGGSKLSQNYTMDSDYKMMKFEYELQKTIREKHNTVKFFQDGCISAVGALEKANKNYDPFGLELEGWCDNVNNQSDRLYDTFGDLYEKWNKPGKSMPPEIALIGILGFSAAKTHFVNASTNNIPSLEEKQKEDPEYIERIRQQAMGKTIDAKSRLKQDVFTEKLTKQYQNAMEQVNDFQKIREMEETKLRSQQTMKLPSLPQSLRSQIQPKSLIENNVIKPNMTQEQYKQFRDNAAAEQQHKMEENLKNKLSRADMESNDSVIRTNADIEDVIKRAEEMSNISSTRKRKKGKKSTTIKLDV